MRAWHLRLSSDGRHPMFPSEQRLRAAVRALARTAGGELALFCIVDDHVHVVLFCERKVAGHRARGLSRVLGAMAAVPLEPAFIKPVETRRHMEWLLRYVLDQPDHHGLAQQPALWTGSCFADIVGARALPGLQLRLHDALPRFQLWQACKVVGLDQHQLAPLPLVQVRALGAPRALQAATAALAVGPDLTGTTAAEVAARSLAVHLATQADIPPGEQCWALQRTSRQLRRLRASPPDPQLLLTARRHLALEEAAGSPAARARSA